MPVNCSIPIALLKKHTLPGRRHLLNGVESGVDLEDKARVGSLEFWGVSESVQVLVSD